MAKVLIVGEDIGHVDLMETTIDGLGYDVVTVYESIDALDIAIEQPFDLVMMGEKMSGLTGYELCTAMRGDPEIDDDLPILMFDNGFLDDDKLKSAGITETILPELDPGLLTEIMVRLTGE
ncbi:MAG: response regulator [Candidatus Hydrogenedentota bacterium]